MQLENRYIVLKLKDVNELGEEEGRLLDRLCDKVTEHRCERGVGPMQCLVIESDWPEYEPALEMLSARVDGQAACTNSDRWNCKYCDKAKTCELLWAVPPVAPTAAAIEAAEFTAQAWNNLKPLKPPVVKHSHYFKDVSHLDTIDVYRVLDLYKVTDPCIQHAVKKLLVAGGRGAGKDVNKDIQEAIDTLERWQEMQAENKPVCRTAAHG